MYALTPPPEESAEPVQLTITIPRSLSYRLDRDGLALASLKEGLEDHVIRKLLMVMLSEDKCGSVRVYIKDRRIINASAQID